MEDREFDLEIENQCRKKIASILYYMEEAKKGDEDAYQTLYCYLVSFKNEIYSSKYYYFIFSFLIFYLDKSIMITNNALREEQEYQELMGLCRSDLKYYLEVSKMLRKYVKDCLKRCDYEALDVIFLSTVKMSYILNCISEYLSYIRNMEKSSNSFIQYVIPESYRDKGEENKKEMEEILKVLGLREQRDV